MTVGRFFFCALLAILPAASIRAESGALQPSGLLVESQHNPVGIAAAQPTFAWTLLSPQIAARNLRQSAYRIVVGTSPFQLAHPTSPLWDSGRIAEPTYWQRPYLGPPLQPHTKYYWKVQTWSGGAQPGSWSEVAHFTTALLSESDWTAHWIAAVPDLPQVEATREGGGAVLSADPAPLPVFRHNILVEKPIASAILFVAGLGQYEVHLNGRDVTKTVMNSGWTDYRKTISYDTYDVTQLLHQSLNTFAILLGNGMYNVEEVKGHYTKFIGSFGQPKCILQLNVRYADGTSGSFVSDASWQSHSGPILYSSIYGGETYDAGTLFDSWDLPGSSQKDWSPAIEVEGSGGRLAARVVPPMIVAETLKSIHTTTPKPGVTVYDLGVNMSGWPSISVRAVLH